MAPEPIQLPPFAPYRTAATLANGWSDQYGALHVAAEYAGVPLAPIYTVRGLWQHGCHAPWFNFSPALLCNNTPGAKSLAVFVARQDQEDLLRADGYNARSIGLPIVYADTTVVARQPGSLLVMPTHTLAGAQFADRAPFERYADEIQTAAVDFRRVVVCVHPSCRQNGLWIGEFSRRGFELIDGAANTDRHALLRMKRLFEQFDAVTTNGWGSHVAYALAFGARVSIHGTQPAYREVDLLRDTTWASDRQALQTARSADTAARREAFLQPFLVPPAAALSDVERGRWLIGADHRVEPAQMRDVLHELVDPAPVRPEEQSRALRSSRREAIARLLAGADSGRKPDAIQALLRMIRAEIATKEPGRIHASLVEAADALRLLEPTLAANLRGEADKFARSQGWSGASAGVTS